jgi:rhodanese-related sulfurtransferase
VNPPFRICRIGHRKNTAKNALVSAKTNLAVVLDMALPYSFTGRAIS